MTVAELPRVDKDVEDRPLAGTAFIDRKMAVPPSKERILFSMLVPACSRHIVRAGLFVDGPEDVDFTLGVRFLNGQRSEGHIAVPEATVRAVQVRDKLNPVSVPLDGQQRLVSLSLNGWCSVNGGAGVLLQVVAGRKGGAGCGHVVVRSGWVCAVKP